MSEPVTKLCQRCHVRAGTETQWTYPRHDEWWCRRCVVENDLQSARASAKRSADDILRAEAILAAIDDPSGKRCGQVIPHAVVSALLMCIHRAERAWVSEDNLERTQANGAKAVDDAYVALASLLTSGDAALVDPVAGALKEAVRLSFDECQNGDGTWTIYGDRVMACVGEAIVAASVVPPQPDNLVRASMRRIINGRGLSDADIH